MPTVSPPPLWQPSAARITASRLHAFEDWLDRHRTLRFSDYQALHHWSVTDPSAFWQAVWQFTDVRHSVAPSATLTGDGSFSGSRWFPDARLNFAENLLRRDDDSPALIGRLENGERQVVSWRDLTAHVAAVAGWLAAQGVGAGDRVAAMLPNVPATVIAMLAASRLGAVWSSCSPDFGPEGVLDRFGQIDPTVFIACDGYYYNGKANNCRDKSQTISERLTAVTARIEVPVLRLTSPPSAGWVSWSEVLATNTLPPPFAQLPFNHPLYILYSSGTTGAPKCIVHSAGGTLLQHLKEHQLHTGIRAGDVFFFYSTCGWMMWNWLVSGLASEATLLLYDGSPFTPGRSALFDLAAEEHVAVFGVGAKYLQAVEKAQVRPIASHQLPQLRTVLSTGSPLADDSFRYVYRDIGSDLCLSSISGGTDIVSCFALGNECLPVYPGELQCLGLGMDVDVWSEEGQPLSHGKGELVCCRPFPSAPLGFWNDPDQRKYQRAYFERFPGVWAHGDFAELTAHGGLIIHGRSDAVLNPGGVRIGTAEIYRQVESVDVVVDSVCVGQRWQQDERVVLFVLLTPGAALTDALESEIRQRIREQTTPRHVPAKIIAVADIPRTRSGKIAELAVRRIINGEPPGNTDGLANPEALSLFKDLPGLALPSDR